MQNSSLTANIKQAFQNIDDAIIRLNKLLIKSDVKQSIVFLLPRTLKEDEHAGQGNIIIKTDDQYSAFEKTLRYYSTFFLENPTYSSKAIGRMPGAISIQTDNPQPILDQIQFVNQLKEEFKQLIRSSFDSQFLRFKFLHAPENYPGLIITYLTRSIHFHFGPLDSASFSWVNKSKQDKKTVSQAINELKKSKGLTPEGQFHDSVSWSDRVDIEISRLQSLPQSQELREHRPLKPKVVCNLLTTEAFDGQPLKERKIQKEGSIPIILVNSSNTKIHPLKDYLLDQDIRPGRARIERQYISNIRNLYIPTN